MASPGTSSVRVDVKGLANVRRALLVLGREAFGEARKGLRTAGREFDVRFAAAHLRGTTGARNVGQRSGQLARSFGHSVKGDRIDRLHLDVGFGPPARPWVGRDVARYARTHLVGGGVGTIHPRKGKYLAIPIDRTRAGMARQSSIADLGAKIIFVRRAAGASSAKRFRAPLDPTKAFAFPMRGRDGWVVTYGGKPKFLLVRSVRVPERVPLHEAFKAYEPTLTKHLANAAKAVHDKANQAGKGPSGG